MPALRLGVDLPHPPGRVWRALTESGPLNEWFQPTTGWPATGAAEGTVGHVFPGGELHSFAPFEIELLEVRAPEHAIFQWRGEDFLSEVEWSITPTGQGCRLSLSQTGFLGSREALRRAELLDGYRMMLAHRLPAALDRLAGIASREAAPPPPQPPPRQQPIGQDTRLRMLSLTAAVAIVVLCASAVSVWLTGSTDVPATGADMRGPGSGDQPGFTLPITPTPSISTPSAPPPQASPTLSTSPEATTSPEPLTAGYRTITLLGLGGFDTEVTISNPGRDAREGWTVVLTMPGHTEVRNRTSDLVNIEQNGQTVTVTPIGPPLAGRATMTFVVRYPALLALGGSITSCTIDGRPCRAG